MHIKKFAFIYFFILSTGLLLLSFQDILFVYNAESQVAKVVYHVPGPEKTFYKLKGPYQVKTMSPAIGYAFDGKEQIYVPSYSCKDGCHEVGSDITIFYKKDKPEEVLVMNFEGFWKYKIYFLIAMGVLLLSSFPYIYYNSSKRPASV